MNGLQGPLRDLDGEPTEDRVAALWHRLERSRVQSERPLLRRTAWGSGLALAAAALLAFWGLASVQIASPPPRLAPLTLATGVALPERIAAQTDRVARLSDGSALHLAAGAEVLFIVNQAGAVELVQRRGRVVYDVAGKGRRWSIEAGAGRVEVIGTRFEVERAARTLDVRVFEGVVLVRSPFIDDGVTRLTAGRRARLVEEAALPSAGSSATTRGDSTVVVPSAGRHDKPGELLGPPVSGDDALRSRAATRSTTKHVIVEKPSEALLRLADQARRRGELSEAELLLERVVARADRRSAVAAFTLAKMRIEDRPEEAAQGFTDALRLGLGEPLRRAAYERRIEALEAAALPSDEARRALRTAYPESR